MPKFKSREEYEKWKAGKMGESPQGDGPPVAPEETPPDFLNDLPPHLRPQEEEEISGKGSFAKWIILAVVAVAGFFIYWQFFHTSEEWTESTYTNWTSGFSIYIPEGWKKFEFSPEMKSAIKAGTVPGTKTLFTLSPINSRHAVYGMMDMQTVLKPDREDISARISAELRKVESMLKLQGYKTSRLEKEIGGEAAFFMRANRYNEIFITGIVLQPPDRILMFQFYNIDGKYESDFWDSVESFVFL